MINDDKLVTQYVERWKCDTLTRSYNSRIVDHSCKNNNNNKKIIYPHTRTELFEISTLYVVMKYCTWSGPEMTFHMLYLSVMQ